MPPSEPSKSSLPADHSARPWRASVAWLALMAALFGLQHLAMDYPGLVERYYARGLFPPLQRGLARASALAPISLSELLALALACWMALGLWRGLRARAHGERGLGQLTRSALRRGLRLAAILYAWFLFAWGINYARSPLAELFAFEVHPTQVSELVALCDELSAEAEAAQVLLPPRALSAAEGGRVAPPSLEGDLAAAIAAAWERAGREYELLAGGSPLVRPALSSGGMTLAGISGIYSPFTGEGHVNSRPPLIAQPYTICHEGAHARGFAREDEANFVAFLVCRAATEPFVRYSGYLNVLLSARAALWRVSRAQLERLDARLPERVRADMQAIVDFWNPKRSRLEQLVLRVAEASNDHYLKAQGQADGAGSYGRVVDLLLAERRARLALEPLPAIEAGPREELPPVSREPERAPR